MVDGALRVRRTGKWGVVGVGGGDWKVREVVEGGKSGCGGEVERGGG